MRSFQKWDISQPSTSCDDELHLEELLSLCIPIYEGPDVDRDLLIELMHLCGVQ